MRATVAAVVVTHRRTDLALRCVESLGLPRRDVVTVVNAPTACDLNALDALRPLCLVVENEAELGYGANLNLGTRALNGRHDVVLLLNDDLVFPPGSVDVLLDALKAHPGAGIVSPALVDEGGHPQAQLYSFPTLAVEIGEVLLAPESVLRRLRGDNGVLAPATGCVETEWVLGAALAVRRADFEAIGGFDERFFMYSEEIDLCKRITELGRSVMVCGDAVVTHLYGNSPGTSAVSAASRRYLLQKHWTPTRRAVLFGLTPLLFAWNLAYTAMRVVVRPAAAADRRAALRDRWRRRVYMRLGPSSERSRARPAA